MREVETRAAHIANGAIRRFFPWLASLDGTEFPWSRQFRKLPKPKVHIGVTARVELIEAGGGTPLTSSPLGAADWTVVAPFRSAKNHGTAQCLGDSTTVRNKLFVESLLIPGRDTRC